MKAIVQAPNKVLREKAPEVTISQIPSKEVQDALDDMIEVLATQDDGIAIAAPQIGVSLRIFVVSGKAFTDLEKEEVLDTPIDIPPPLICINPHILKKSKRKKKLEEGCLSVRWKYGFVERATNITIEAYDRYGNKFTRGAGGLLAQIFQHEIDHLEGVLFIDKAEDIADIPPEDILSDDEQQ